MTLVICDSSSLILISKLEILDLLIKVFKKILIPKAVHIESVEQGKKLKKIDAFLIERRINEGKIIIENIENIVEKEKFMEDFNLHEGEAEALILYSEKNADLFVTDDYRTLKVCRILEIKYFTTPLFIIRCFEMKKLSKNIAILKFEKLEEFGWYNEENIVEFKKKIDKLEG